MGAFTNTIIQTFQDRNGEGNSKNAIAFTAMLLIAFDVICYHITGKHLPDFMFWGLVGLAGGSASLGLFERQNKTTAQTMAEKPTNNEVMISANETGTAI